MNYNPCYYVQGSLFAEERAHCFVPSVRNSSLDDGGREVHEFFFYLKSQCACAFADIR